MSGYQRYRAQHSRQEPLWERQARGECRRYGGKERAWLRLFTVTGGMVTTEGAGSVWARPRAATLLLLGSCRRRRACALLFSARRPQAGGMSPVCHDAAARHSMSRPPTLRHNHALWLPRAAVDTMREGQRALYRPVLLLSIIMFCCFTRAQA